MLCCIASAIDLAGVAYEKPRLLLKRGGVGDEVFRPAPKIPDMLEVASFVFRGVVIGAAIAVMMGE